MGCGNSSCNNLVWILILFLLLGNNDGCNSCNSCGC